MEYQARKIEAIKDGAPGSGCGPFFPPPTPPIPVPHTLQKVVVSSGTGPDLDLPLVLGLPLQLKLAASRVVLNQGSKKEILALPALDLASLLKLWVQPQGRLFLGALPGKTGTFVLLSTPLEIERENKTCRCVFLVEGNLWKWRRKATRREGIRGSRKKCFKKVKSESWESGGQPVGPSCPNAPSGPPLCRRDLFCLLLLEWPLGPRPEAGHGPGPEQK